MVAELIKIKSVYSSLSRTQKRLADYILKNNEEFLFLSVQDLARAANVSVATVSRFAQALGYSRFKDFRAQIGRSVVLSFNDIYQAITPSDTDGKIIEKVFTGNIKSLEDTFKILSRAHFIKAVRTIAKAQRLICFGIGSSGNIARDTALRFSQLDIQSEAYVDSYQMLNQALRMKKGDVALGISHSGRSAITVKALKLASENGAVTIGISNYMKSPLLKVSNVFLCTSFPENGVNVAALSSVIAQMCLVDALYLLTARHRKVDFKKVERLNTYTEDILRLPTK